MKNSTKLLYKNFKLLALVMFLMSMLSIYVYMNYLTTKTEVFTTIKKDLIAEKLSLFHNYVTHLQLEHNIKSVKSMDKKELKHMEHDLELIKDKDITYLYMLYKDDNGQLRYLIDTTKNELDKAARGQLFAPQTDIWHKCYNTKKYQISLQKNLQTLWITLAYPVVYQDKVVAVLGADFTYDIYNQLIEHLQPMENLFFYITVFMIMLFILSYLLLYLYYKINKKTYLDQLTQIYNRQYLQEFIQQKSLQNYYLMLMDIDYFKRVNDHYGHDVGDDVLVAVVNEIKSNLREDDLIVRFGGEEFLIFISKKSTQEIEGVAQRLRLAIENLTIRTHSHILNITISLGVNPCPYKARNLDEAIKICDEQLYIAKNEGRNRISVFKDNNSEYSTSHNRITDIQEAVNYERILCAIQPIMSVATQECNKYEVLMRMKDKDGKIIYPDAFLPFIKNTSLYLTLTKIILQKSIALLKENDFSLSINLDLQDILNGDIIALFKETFEKHHEFAQRITIEILEHEEINDFEQLKENLQMFKSLGFSIAIDDFGSGYANFIYLVNLDIDILKIDGSLIRGIDEKSAAYQVVKTILYYAANMNILTIAEQVETKEEYDTLVTLGVDYIQGYYLGKPVIQEEKSQKE